MQRKAGLVCVLVVAMAAAQAQETPQPYLDSPSAEKTATWLRSVSPQDRAWGAYWAVKQKDASFLPVLEGLAERWERLPGEEEIKKLDSSIVARMADERDAMAGVLDGVIQFNGNLTPQALGKLVHDFPAQAIILLARMPSSESRETLLKLYAETSRQSTGLRRVAARMLALDPPPGFAAHMLKMTIWAEIYVSPPGSDMSEEGDYGACGAQTPSMARQGWPGVGLYRLVESDENDQPGDFVVIEGRHPINGRRIEAAQWGYLCSLPDQSDKNRVQMIAQMLNEDDSELPLHSYEEIHIHTTSTENYLKQLNEFVAAEKRQIVLVQTQLEARNLLTQQEIDSGDAQPRLLLKMIDEVQPGKFEVPMPALGNGVEWYVPEKEWYDPKLDW